MARVAIQRAGSALLCWDSAATAVNKRASALAREAGRSGDAVTTVCGRCLWFIPRKGTHLCVPLRRMQTARALGRALSILHVTYHVYRGRYEQLRPEFVAACGAPLSSDAFSGFGLLDAATHNDAVRSAFSRLVGQVVKQLAHDIAVDKVPCFDGAQLSEAMHKRGINMRLLPLLANELTYREALQLRVIRTEMVVRAVKGELRARLRCVQVVHSVVQPTTRCAVDSGCACAVASSAHRSPPPHKHAIERSASLRRVSSTCCLGVDLPVQSFGRSVCMSLSRCANHPSRHR